MSDHSDPPSSIFECIARWLVAARDVRLFMARTINEHGDAAFVDEVRLGEDVRFWTRLCFSWQGPA